MYVIEHAPHRTYEIFSGWVPTRVAFFPQACRLTCAETGAGILQSDRLPWMKCVLGSHRPPQSVMRPLAPSAFLLSGPIRPPLARAELARCCGCRVFDSMPLKPSSASLLLFVAFLAALAATSSAPVAGNVCSCHAPPEKYRPPPHTLTTGFRFSVEPLVSRGGARGAGMGERSRGKLLVSLR